MSSFPDFFSASSQRTRASFQTARFTNGIASLTAEDGSDTARYLDELFQSPRSPNRSTAKHVPDHFAEFGYVNGKLFAAQATAPAVLGAREAAASWSAERSTGQSSTQTFSGR